MDCKQIQQLFGDMDMLIIFSIGMLYTNHDTRSIEGLRNKAEYSGIAVKSDTQGRCETGKSGDWGTRHGSPHDSDKGGVNKCRGCTR